MQFRKKTWEELLKENTQLRENLRIKSKEWWIFLILGFLLGTSIWFNLLS